jgi:hypothetical protein
MMHGTHLFGLLNVSNLTLAERLTFDAGLEPAAAAVVVMAALKFSQCNVLWESFPWDRGSRF